MDTFTISDLRAASGRSRGSILRACEVLGIQPARRNTRGDRAFSESEARRVLSFFEAQKNRVARLRNLVGEGEYVSV